MIAALLAPLAVLADERAAPAPPSPAGNGRVKVKVLASNGKTPVSGAVLRAYHLGNGQVYASAPSGGKGECRITGVPYGYLDVSVETKDGVFVGNQVVNVPPVGTAVVSLTLTRFSDHSPAWWSGRTPRSVPGTRTESQGVAEIDVKSRGKAFWTSPGGVAIVGGVTGLLLISAARHGGKSY